MTFEFNVTDLGGDEEVAKMMRKTRLKYHYAIRFVMKENFRVRNNRMADAISENRDRVLWDEVRKISKANNDLSV